MKRELVIFLDIDGVLNYERWFHSRTYKKMYESYDSSRMINRHNLKILRLLCRITGAKVIMSSSWRYGWNEDGTVRQEDDGSFPEQRTDQLLRKYGVCISGITGKKIEKLQNTYELDNQLVNDFVNRNRPAGLEMSRHTFIQYARGSQILDWLERNQYTGNFLILDDDWQDIAIYNCLKSHLVITEFYNKFGGFRCKHLLKCLWKWLKN